MNIIGIDLGTNKAATTRITGDISDPKFDVTLIEADPKLTTDQRFLDVLQKINTQLALIKPELVIVEYPFNIMGHAKVVLEMFGAVRFLALQQGLPFKRLEQTRIKKYVTGSGKAEKSDMRMQVYKEYGLDLSEDQADSFWIAHMGMSYLYGTDKKHRQDSVDAIKEKEATTSKVKKKRG